MPRTVANNLRGVLDQRTHRHARLWTIARTDGVSLHFTDHSHSIEFDGDVYTPAGGPDPSAHRKESGFEGQNRELRGAITSAAITTDDLRAGRYHGAEVTERLVDWAFPFLGAITTDVYELGSVSWDGEQWEGQIEGTARLMEPDIGQVYSRRCNATLGDARCGVDLPAISVFLVDVSAVDSDEPRRIFRASSSALSSPGAGWFDLGQITWRAGANEDLTAEIRSHTIVSGTTVEFVLQIPMPFDITTSDQFDVSPGCNKLAGVKSPDGHCKNKFNNLPNFRAQPFLPGPDRALWTP